MSLRPRYSLLTLLILTALVAGGVKLWHGPHRMVLKDIPTFHWEKEYTYTRDWRGNQIINGPLVYRRYEGRKLVYFEVLYARQGNEVDWMYESSKSNYIRYPEPEDVVPSCPLSAEECLAFQQVRDAEIERLLAAGTKPDQQYEGERCYPDFFSHSLGR